MKSQKNKTLLTLLTVAIGTFMSALDTSVVNIAAPVIQNNLSVSLSMVEWVITAYLLVISSMLLTFGKISDLYGRKRVYCTGFIIFTIGSLLCGLADQIGVLIAFRVLQALGAGMIFSTGPAIITNAVPANRRGKALSVSAVAVAIAVCTGPVLGGFLASSVGWQSIFFLNVPIGVIGISLALKNIQKDDKQTSIPFDILGSILIFIALILILLPLDLVGKSNLSPALFLIVLTGGILTAVGFLLYERKCSNPILNTSLFKNRVFTASNVAALFNYMAQFILIFLAPFYFEKLRMFPASTAGLLYIPMPLATLCISPISGILSDRFDSRYISTAGMGIMAFGMFLLSSLSINTSTGFIIIAMMITGLGSGMFQTPNNSAVMGSVPPEYRGTASATLATMRNIGMVLGVAISGSLFSFNLNHATVMNTAKGIKGLQLQQTSFTYALHITFIAAGVVALLAMTASSLKGKVRIEIKKVSI